MSWEEVAKEQPGVVHPCLSEGGWLGQSCQKKEPPHILWIRQLGLQIWLITTQSDTAL